MTSSGIWTQSSLWEAQWCWPWTLWWLMQCTLSYTIQTVHDDVFVMDINLWEAGMKYATTCDPCTQSLSSWRLSTQEITVNYLTPPFPALEVLYSTNILCDSVLFLKLYDALHYCCRAWRSVGTWQCHLFIALLYTRDFPTDSDTEQYLRPGMSMLNHFSIGMYWYQFFSQYSLLSPCTLK